MGHEDCFFIYVTTRKTAACVSTVLLTLGIVGLLTVPFLPYSFNEAPFYLVMGYMTLLVIAFVLSLCGTLTDSKVTVSLGLLLGIAAFLFWVLLTVPSLMSFADDFTNDFCLGNHCGESHWLVPRDWSSNRTGGNRPTAEYSRIYPFRKIRSVTDTKIERNSREMNETEELASGNGVKAKETGTGSWNNEDHFDLGYHRANVKQEENRDGNSLNFATFLKKNGQISDLAGTVRAGDGKNTISKKQNSLMFENKNDEIENKFDIVENEMGSEDDEMADHHRQHAVSKREEPQLRQIHDIRRYIIEGKALMQLNKTNSILLALVYALLFCCCLAILCMNLASFEGRYCDELPRPPVCPPHCGHRGDSVCPPRQSGCRPRKNRSKITQPGSPVRRPRVKRPTRSEERCPPTGSKAVSQQKSILKSGCQTKLQDDSQANSQARSNVEHRVGFKAHSQHNQPGLKTGCPARSNLDGNSNLKSDLQSKLKTGCKSK